MPVRSEAQWRFMQAIAALHRGVSVFAGVGERIREGHELWREIESADNLESGMGVVAFEGRFESSAEVTGVVTVVRVEVGQVENLGEFDWSAKAE